MFVDFFEVAREIETRHMRIDFVGTSEFLN